MDQRLDDQVSYFVGNDRVSSHLLEDDFKELTGRRVNTIWSTDIIIALLLYFDTVHGDLGQDVQIIVSCEELLHVFHEGLFFLSDTFFLHMLKVKIFLHFVESFISKMTSEWILDQEFD